MSSKKIWFSSRRYGWGWTPITWQGWLCVATLVVYLLGIIVWLVKVTPSHSTSNDGLLKFCIGFLLISAGIFVLTGICFAKGEKPSWNWANKKNKENNHE